MRFLTNIKLSKSHYTVLLNLVNLACPESGNHSGIADSGLVVLAGMTAMRKTTKYLNYHKNEIRNLIAVFRKR